MQFNMMTNGNIGMYELSHYIYMCEHLRNNNTACSVQPREDIEQCLKKHLDWLCDEAYYTGLVTRIDARYV